MRPASVRRRIVPLGTAVVLAAGCSSDGGGAAAPLTTTTSPSPATNGVEELDGPQIVERATDALAAAPSAVVSVESSAESDRDFSAEASYDGDGNVTGSGTVDSADFRFTEVDDELYVLGDEQFWRDNADVPAVLAGQMADRWFVVPDGLLDAQLRERVTSLEGLAELPGDGSDFTREEVTEVDGEPVVTVINSREQTLSVSLVDEPYPVRVEGVTGTATLSGFGTSVTVVAPPDALDVGDFGVELG